MKLNKSLNKNRPKQISEIVVTEFKISERPAKVSNFKLVQCCEQEDTLCFDLDLVYLGEVQVRLQFSYTPIQASVGSISITKRFNIDVLVNIKSVVSTVRVCFMPFRSGKPWSVQKVQFSQHPSH